MKKPFTLIIVTVCLFFSTTGVFAEQAATQHPIVIMHTNKGPITIELYPDKAPVTVANFLKYVTSGFYNGTIFHRVIKHFMIQGGGFTKNLTRKATLAPIVNESSNRLHNDRYTIAMARTTDPDSATSQFFINTRINSRLDAQGGHPGYAVFGKVIDGQSVVRAIEKTKTHRVSFFNNLPVKPIVIESAEVKKQASQ